MNPFDNDLFILTKAVDPWYQLDFFTANLKREGCKATEVICKKL